MKCKCNYRRLHHTSITKVFTKHPVILWWLAIVLTKQSTVAWQNNSPLRWHIGIEYFKCVIYEYIHVCCHANANKQRPKQAFRIKMASGNDMTELSSDSDDTRITRVPTCHTGFMKAKLIDYLSDATDFSVDIWHTYNNDAQLVFNFLSQPGKWYMRYIAHGERDAWW